MEADSWLQQGPSPGITLGSRYRSQATMTFMCSEAPFLCRKLIYYRSIQEISLFADEQLPLERGLYQSRSV